MEQTILTYARYAFEGFYFIMIFYIISSWIPALRQGKLGQLAGAIVEPYLSIFRRVIPPVAGTLDLSPIVAFLVYDFITRFALEGLRVILLNISQFFN